MAQTIGTLIIDMAANVAKLQADMQQARTLVGNAADGMVTAAKTAGAALGAIGVGLSMGAIVNEFKQAVGAMAALDDAAEMVGASVENVSRLMGVAAESGKSLDDVVAITAKLQSAMIGAEADTGKAALAFKALGLNLSTFDDSTDALIAFARGLNEYEDGANKTQLAIAVLGKAGAQALPFLKDLANAGELQARVSTEQAAAAEQYEKMMARSVYETEQFKISIVGSVLPAMLRMIDEFKSARAAGLGFIDALNTIPFAMSKLEQIEAQRKKIADLKTEMQEIGKVRLFFDPGAEERLATQLAGEEKRLGILTNQGRAQGLLRTQAEELYGPNGYGERASKMQAPALADDKKIKAAADATKKLAETYDDLIKGITAKNAETKQELENNGKLTDAQKFEMDARKKVAEVLGQLSPLQRANIENLIREGVESLKLRAAQESEKDELKRLAAQMELTAKARETGVAEMRKQTEEADKALVSAQSENAQIGLTKTQLQDLTARRWEEKAAINDQKIAEFDLLGVMGDEYDAMVGLSRTYRETAAEIRRGARLTAISDEAKAAKDEWTRQSDAIGNSLTDALLRGFEGGKGFAQNLVTTLKNMFNTMILKPIIQAVVNPISGSLTGMLGLTGTANAAGGAAGGGSGLLGSLGSIGGLFGAGGLGGALTAGAGWLTGATTLGGSFAAAGSLIGTGTLAGSMSGLAMGAGALAPFVLGALALNSIFGKKRGGPKLGGSFSTDAGARLFTPSGADEEAGALGQTALGSISDLATQLGGTAGQFNLGIGFDSDPQGTAGNRIASYLRDSSGRSLLDNTIGRDVGRDDAALKSGLGDETSRLVLAGLQASNLPEVVKTYLAGINVATFSASQLDSTIAAAKALLPAVETPEKTLLDRALEDPGTYAAVSTEVRELVTLSTDHLAIATEQRDTQKLMLDALTAQLAQAQAAFARMIAAGESAAQRGRELVDLSVLHAGAPTLVRVVA